MRKAMKKEKRQENARRIYERRGRRAGIMEGGTDTIRELHQQQQVATEEIVMLCVCVECVRRRSPFCAFYRPFAAASLVCAWMARLDGFTADDSHDDVAAAVAPGVDAAYTLTSFAVTEATSDGESPALGL